MAIDPVSVQAVATGIFGALSAFFCHKATAAQKGLNGHAETVTRLRRRLNSQSKRIRRLEHESREAMIEREHLQVRIKGLEARGA